MPEYKRRHSSKQAASIRYHSLNLVTDWQIYPALTGIALTSAKVNTSTKQNYVYVKKFTNKS